MIAVDVDIAHADLGDNKVRHQRALAVRKLVPRKSWSCEEGGCASNTSRMGGWSGSDALDRISHLPVVDAC